MDEKRIFTRVKYNAKASVQLNDAIILDARILDISLHGALFEVPEYCMFHLGDKWNLKFRLPQSDICVEFGTEVIHSQNRTVGVKFTYIEIDSMIHLRSLMEGLTANPQQVEKEIGFLCG